MRITAAVTSLIILFHVFHVLGIDPQFYEDETSYESGIPSIPIELRKFRRQIGRDKMLTPSQKVRRRQACMYKTNCYKRERKNNASSANWKSALNSDRRNMQLRNGFGSQRRGKPNFGPKFQTKNLSPVRQYRHRENSHNFRTLDGVTRNAYRADKRLDNHDQNPQFFNVVQTFFHNQDVLSQKSHYGKSKGSKGSWLSGGFDIDSTLELVSTKSLSGTYRDYDDEYQKSLSSVYQDYHNPLRHSLVNLLTELFVTLNNTTLKNDYEVVSGLADENVEISESANDFCQRWIDHKDKLEAVFLGSSTRLPSCPCFYPSNIFYNDKIWDKRQQKNFRWRDASGKSQRMDIYKPGAFYCVRSLLTQGSGSAAAQHCCYDQERRLITRGSGAGTPNFVSPEASQLLHEKIDLLPWQLCKGDFSRFNSMRPPNNDNDCQLNPDEEEYQRQKAERKSF